MAVICKISYSTVGLCVCRFLSDPVQTLHSYEVHGLHNVYDPFVMHCLGQYVREIIHTFSLLTIASALLRHFLSLPPINFIFDTVCEICLSIFNSSFFSFFFFFFFLLFV